MPIKKPRSANPKRLVQVYNGHPRLVLPRTAVARLIHALDRAGGGVVPPLAPGQCTPRARCKKLFAANAGRRIDWVLPAGEFSVAFLTDAAQTRVHADFLSDPTPTDVITFPAEPKANLAGEVCVSVDTARRSASEHDVTFSEELALYIVHGYLHLCGYDDKTTRVREEMRLAEAAAMNVLRTAKCIPKFSLR